MKKWFTQFVRNLRFLGTVDVKTMIDFETELMEQHNALVRDIKAINLVLNREVGYDAGRFLRPRPGHIDLLTRVEKPLTLPLEIATQVAEYLEADRAQNDARLAREKAATAVATLPPELRTRLKKARRRRAKR